MRARKGRQTLVAGVTDCLDEDELAPKGMNERCARKLFCSGHVQGKGTAAEAGFA
jgi:hypothetical protein